MRGPTASAISAQRHFADRHAVQLARGRQRAQQPRMLLVAGQDLIAWLELRGRPIVCAIPSLVHVVSATSAGVAAERRGVGGAQLLVQLPAALEMGLRATLGELALELLRRGAHRARAASGPSVPAFR